MYHNHVHQTIPQSCYVFNVRRICRSQALAKTLLLFPHHTDLVTCPFADTPETIHDRTNSDVLEDPRVPASRNSAVGPLKLMAPLDNPRLEQRAQPWRLATSTSVDSALSPCQTRLSRFWHLRVRFRPPVVKEDLTLRVRFRPPGRVRFRPPALCK